MKIIKLDATDSTNSYLKHILHSQGAEDFTVVMAHSQLKGRGQRGAEWQSEPGKNLTFSMLKTFDALDAHKQFSLNSAVSLALIEVLDLFKIPDLAVKWPNDIMSGNSKIAGVLIENTLLKGHIQRAVIGIGLNVNQTVFPELAKASSLKLRTGRNFELEILLKSIIARLKIALPTVESRSIEDAIKAYEQRLFRKDQPTSFQIKDDAVFTGCIRGISTEGKLLLETEDNKLHQFETKELKMLY